MNVHYGNDTDALYIQLGDQSPDGVIEVAEGLNVDTTSEDKIVGIEILNASKRLNLDTILSYVI